MTNKIPRSQSMMPQTLRTYIGQKTQLNALDNAAYQELRIALATEKQQNIFLSAINIFLVNQADAVSRLKCWNCIHYLLLNDISLQIIQKAQLILENHGAYQHTQTPNQKHNNLELCLSQQIQKIYVSYLTRFAIWKEQQLMLDEQQIVNLGFSEINKLKEMLKLQSMFKHFHIYFVDHLYAEDIFKNCVIHINQLWQSVCRKVQRLTRMTLKQKKIQDDEYLFIVEADRLQDLLQLFVNCSTYTKCLPAHLKLQSYNLLMEKVQTIHQERNNNQQEKRSLSKLIVKVFSKQYDHLLETQCESTSQNRRYSKREYMPIPNCRLENLQKRQQIEILNNIKFMEDILKNDI